MKTNTPDAIVYCRSSLPTFRSEQIAAEIVQYAHAFGYVVDPSMVFIDETNIATPFAQRVGGAKVIEIIRRGEVKHLFIQSLNRISRQYCEIRSVTNAMIDDGASIHVMDIEKVFNQQCRLP